MRVHVRDREAGGCLLVRNIRNEYDNGPVELLPGKVKIITQVFLPNNLSCLCPKCAYIGNDQNLDNGTDIPPNCKTMMKIDSLITSVHKWYNYIISDNNYGK